MLRCVILLTTVVVSASAHAGPTSVEENVIFCQAFDAINPNVFFRDESLGLSKTVNVPTSGGSASKATFLWTPGTDGDEFHYTFDHMRNERGLAGASTFSSLTFTVDRNVTYSLEGSYTLLGSHAISSVVQLRDSTGNVLFEDGDGSVSTLDESFTVGLFGEGDASTSGVGVPTGTLLANQTYTLLLIHGIQNAPSPFDTNPAEASGSVTLTIIDAPSVVSVPIDVRPGGESNAINLAAGGVLPVAIFGTEDFDALAIDEETILFGDPELIDAGAGLPVPAVRSAAADVDGDGLDDLVVFFSLPEIAAVVALDADSVEAVLIGETVDGTAIVGVDSVRIVPPM